MNMQMRKEAGSAREDRADAIAVDCEYVMDLPPREVMSLFTMPTLTDPTATGSATDTAGTTGTTGTTSPTTTSPTTSSPVATPTDLSSLPIVSKLDPSRLGII